MTAWTLNEIQQIKKLAEAGASRLLIAAKMRRGMRAVVTVAKQHGIRIRSPREIRKASGLSPNWASNREL